jgi:hypothetical protein
MPIATVQQLCTPSAIVKSDSLVEQVAQIEDFASGKIDGREFFQRNYFTDGLSLLVRRGFERLAGKSEDGAFYLTQAMGGGKTHSLIAFGLLAADPTLRRDVVPKLAAGADFGAAKVVIFNGHQNPNTFLWGFIAEKLGRPDVMAPFWRNGAKTPGLDEWVAVIGNEPVLILLDELPSYLQMAQGESVGTTTLGDLTIGALERLFNALPRCARACVVVTNLTDDVYLDGSNQLRALIDNALAEKINAADGNSTASAVAKVLLMSSLSTAESPLRGLTDGELIETLVDPLLEVSEIKTSLGRLQGQAWYLFLGVDNRVFFGQTANVTAEITEIAANIAEEQVDQSLRNKLQEVFKPRTGTLYSDRMAILPALDEILLDDDRPTLIILERPADKLPQDFVDWWNKQELQNRVLVLTADPNAVSTLRTSARRMRAIEKVEERIKGQHGSESPQMTELQGVKGREAAGFTSALRETFKTIVFPTGKSLRKVDDFRMEFDRNDYSGEQQIIDILTKRGKFVPTDKFDAQFDNIRLDAEEFLFDADAVQPSSLRRNAAVRSAWFWLPRSGLDQLVRIAVQRGYWREKEGLVAKKWERRTHVTARQDDFAQDPMVTGRFQINVTPEDADIVYFSESGPPDPKTAQKLDGRVYETMAPAVWFLGVDSKGSVLIGDPCEWRAPIRVKPDVKRMSGGYKVTFTATPRSAVIHATFDDTDPKIGPMVGAEVDVPKEATRLRTVAEVNGQFSQEESAPLQAGAGEGTSPKQVLKPDSPAVMTSRFEPKDTAAAFSVLDRLAKTPNVHILGGSIDVNGGRSEADFLTLRLGRDVPVFASDLDALLKSLVEKLNAPAPNVKLRIDSIAFPTGRDLTRFCDESGEDFDRVEWKQD